MTVFAYWIIIELNILCSLSLTHQLFLDNCLLTVNLAISDYCSFFFVQVTAMLLTSCERALPVSNSSHFYLPPPKTVLYFPCLSFPSLPPSHSPPFLPPSLIPYKPSLLPPSPFSLFPLPPSRLPSFTLSFPPTLPPSPFLSLPPPPLSLPPFSFRLNCIQIIY